ncbi:MAG: FHA domain-containing protein [Planctomycetota bacterium]|nr:MAG: FHA domain-containing protein [Planctomycetota bacterium]
MSELHLTFIKGPLEGQSLEFQSPQTIVIGRASTAHLRIPDGKLSRHHCKLFYLNHTWFIEDLGSKNGTYFEGEKIHRKALQSGDLILVGNSGMTFFLPHELQNLQNLRFCTLCNSKTSDFISIKENFICQTCFLQETKGLFTLENKIGLGGMGAVFQGSWQNQRVAIKLIFSEESWIESNYLREVKTLSRLNHPNIVKLFDAGKTPHFFYLIMEYVDGKNLYSLLQENPELPLFHRLHFIAQIGFALCHSFAKKVIHRDITPTNILITSLKVAKLSDFGIAKIQDQSTSGLTKSGEGKGTLEYAPPEQITNALHVDQRADIYSLGSTLYFCLTGRPPFQEQGEGKLVQAILNKYPLPPSHFNPKVPCQIDEIVMKCLQKDPNKRYQRPEELYKELYYWFHKLKERQMQ